MIHKRGMKDKMKYVLLTQVHGRGKAEVIESLLGIEGIDAVLVEEAIYHFTPSNFLRIGKDVCAKDSS